jgi:hypothetical protein
MWMKVDECVLRISTIVLRKRVREKNCIVGLCQVPDLTQRPKQGKVIYPLGKKTSEKDIPINE